MYSVRSTPFSGLGSLALGALLLISFSTEARAGGFEVPENSTLSVARGGTGAVNKRDPSALYFNPALLPRARGYQLLINSNFLNMNVDFQRDPLVYQRGNRTVEQEFEPASNSAGIFPAPFFTTSWDLGIDDFALAAGVFGPSAYGNTCYGEFEDGVCVSSGSAARNMVVSTDMFVMYLSLGAGYAFDLGAGKLSLGLTAMAAHQRTNFSTIIEADFAPSPPWEEDPDQEAFFQGEDLAAWAPTGIVGIAYEIDGFRLGASYRPPIHWEAKGRAVLDLPDDYDDLNTVLTDDALTLRTWHAGSLRLGWGFEGGSHPGDAARPLWDLEFNVVWENWSLVDNFEVELAGELEVREIVHEDGSYHTIPLEPIYQSKGYKDTWSLRGGMSFGLLTWLTVHGGGFLETGAQPVAYTNADFVSWERYAAGLGGTLHLPAGIDLDLAMLYIHSPARAVRSGRIYNQIPMSQCVGPDYDNEACQNPGTPPGNPQNEGTWTSNYQIASVGVTWRY
ncbi:MAG: OmpP1/FadL family transporter [Bradymonadaceae bacterium]